MTVASPPSTPPRSNANARRDAIAGQSPPDLARAALLAPFLADLDRYLTTLDPLAIDRAHHIPPEVLRTLADLGVFGASIPERFGGTDLGLAGATAIVETLARRDRALATTVGLHLGLGTRGLVAFASPDQQARWLPGLASGQTLAAFGTTEANAGSDLARLQTRAVVRGDRVTVQGEKLYVTNGGLAGLYTFTVAVTGFGDFQASRALVFLERSDPGLVVGREEDKLGLRGSSTTALHLDVDVPADRLLGPPGAGPDQLAHILAWGRTAMAAGCCGTAQAALDLTLQHVRLRQQFGRPLAAQPVVRAQLADMIATLTTMRALVAATTRASDDLERERLSLSSKIMASDGDCAICDQALQLHGGSGYLEDTGLSLLLRDARVTRIFEGANDVLLTRLGQLELTTPRAAPPDHPLSLLLTTQLDPARKRGLAALRDPLVLHRIGRLALLRDAALALAALAADPHRLTPRMPRPTAADLAHAESRLLEAARAHLVRRDLDTTELIARHVLDQRDQDAQEAVS